MSETRNLDHLKVEQFGPCRFIGKSVYAPGQIWQIFDSFIFNSKWIFDALEVLTEYAVNGSHNFALKTWDKYNEQTKMMGYTVGRFMKADTPVPEGMDFFDFPAANVAKGLFRCLPTDDIGLMVMQAEKLVKNAVEQQAKYTVTTWNWIAEVYPVGYKENIITDADGKTFCGTYMSCEEK